MLPFFPDAQLAVKDIPIIHRCRSNLLKNALHELFPSTFPYISHIFSHLFPTFYPPVLGRGPMARALRGSGRRHRRGGLGAAARAAARTGADAEGRADAAGAVLGGGGASWVTPMGTEWGWDISDWDTLW